MNMSKLKTALKGICIWFLIAIILMGYVIYRMEHMAFWDLFTTIFLLPIIIGYVLIVALIITIVIMGVWWLLTR